MPLKEMTKRDVSVFGYETMKIPVLLSPKWALIVNLAYPKVTWEEETHLRNALWLCVVEWGS